MCFANLSPAFFFANDAGFYRLLFCYVLTNCEDDVYCPIIAQTTIQCDRRVAPSSQIK